MFEDVTEALAGEVLAQWYAKLCTQVLRTQTCYLVQCAADKRVRRAETDREKTLCWSDRFTSLQFGSFRFYSVRSLARFHCHAWLAFAFLHRQTAPNRIDWHCTGRQVLSLHCIACRRIAPLQESKHDSQPLARGARAPIHSVAALLCACSPPLQFAA